MTYKEWNKTRRQRFPDARHTECGSTIGQVWVAAWSPLSSKCWVSRGA